MAKVAARYQVVVVVVLYVWMGEGVGARCLPCSWSQGVARRGSAGIGHSNNGTPCVGTLFFVDVVTVVDSVIALVVDVRVLVRCSGTLVCNILQS